MFYSVKLIINILFFCTKILFIFIVSSCFQGETIENPNKYFVEKYGQKVYDIKVRNGITLGSIKGHQVNIKGNSIKAVQSNPLVKDEFDFLQERFFSSSEKISKKPTEEELSNIFNVTYTGNYLDPYRFSVFFDDLQIPSNDLFGVRTNLGEKDYNFIGNDVLQSNIDFIYSMEKYFDKENSIRLIEEQKHIKRNNYDNANKKDKSNSNSQKDISFNNYYNIGYELSIIL